MRIFEVYHNSFVENEVVQCQADIDIQVIDCSLVFLPQYGYLEVNIFFNQLSMPLQLWEPFNISLIVDETVFNRIHNSCGLYQHGIIQLVGSWRHGIIIIPEIDMTHLAQFQVKFKRSFSHFKLVLWEIVRLFHPGAGKGNDSGLFLRFWVSLKIKVCLRNRSKV